MKTILVVDDEPDILDLLVDILHGEGYRMLAARDGAAALEVLAEADADLVITDTMMPRLNGIALLHSMREHTRLQDLPVIVMSAVARPDLDNFDSVTFLLKPFDLMTLLEVVATALGETHS